MSSEARILWVAVGVMALLLVVLYVPDRVQRELRPEPVRAFVAIQPDGEEAAREGRVEIAAGASFRLHAVLEAAGRSGRRVFFTEAPALIVDGERVPEDALRSWPGPEKAKVLWFSVEGIRPFLELGDDESLDSFEFKSIFRPDWPRAWSIPGSLWPARQALADDYEGPGGLPFGTQRYQVRIELFGVSSALVPAATFESPTAADLPAAAAGFATVVSQLEGALALPSRVFGLSRIEVPDSVFEREAAALQALYDDSLAFSDVPLLRAMLDGAGVEWEALEWSAIDLAAGPAWAPDAVSPGDLLRAGERVVVLYEDRGEAGVLDYEDLCFDFREGAQVAPLRDVFSGEGLVEWTGLEATVTEERRG